MSKIFKVLLILVSIIWTIWSVANAFLNSGVMNLLPLASLIPVFAALYSEVDWIYIQVNKVRSYFSAKTVSFTPKFQYAVGDEISVVQVKKNLDETLISLGQKVNTKRQQKYSEGLIHYDIVTESGLSYDLDLTVLDQEELTLLILKVHYQVSYRDVNKTWKEFCGLQEALFDNFARSSESKPRYDVTIQTNIKNFNPFYRLTIRRLGKAEVQNFLLRFTDNQLTVTTSQHKIYASSDMRSDIDKVVKDYVPLSKIL
ncbi:hypothetical protein AUQ39_05850 [Lacticaseibacillus casei]|uniref:Uncharacterized protein n=1 Tax=Lacticaseibacillus zeae TaxID=57037 RepID=A0A5R8LQV0_LACZE|nr:hypothetical protein [Lacticaseibacillus zeae]OLS09582.1 hypothetical protein AUQ39_05850 [Lacticaseibacillus casei]QVI31097.1 hypothetical protein KG087_09150 [Lacticaseibacillus zeae]TLF39500.1 hypothetical protein FEI14_12485 [Lacticaseibacillus zeae]